MSWIPSFATILAQPAGKQRHPQGHAGIHNYRWAIALRSATGSELELPWPRDHPAEVWSGAFGGVLLIRRLSETHYLEEGRPVR